MEDSSYPFEFYGGDTNLYSFITTKQVVYFVRFIPSAYLFNHVDGLTLDAFEITISIADNPNGERVPADTRIYKTITAVFNDFFNSKDKVVLFICDTSGNRQQARARKFTAWFYRSLKDIDSEVVKIDRYILGEGKAQIMLSMFIHIKHPHRAAAVDAFFSMGTDDK